VSHALAPRRTRRFALALASAAASLLWRGRAEAIEPEVPIRLQVSLLDRVLPYDRNLATRVHGRLSVVVVVDALNADSVRIGALLLSELASLDSFGSYPLTAARVTFGSLAALVDDCKRLRAGVVYVTPGIREPIEKLATALSGLRVLTACTVPEQVAQGMIVGSAVRSGKPRVLVNLRQARLQDVDFRADFLRMAEVVG
jgi:hypothetical protein